MDITISHLSGSRAGETQVFNEGVSIRIGRHPDSEIRFDPHQDRLVSAQHAEITAGAQGWILRDTNSSNGTFVGGERVKEKPLRPGDVIELGTNGPRLKVQFQSKMEAIPGTVIGARAGAGTPPPVGGTVVMSLNDAQRAAPIGIPPGMPVLPAAQVRPAAKRSSVGKKIAIVFSVVFLLLTVALAAAVMVRRSNVRKIRAAQAVAAKQAQQDAARAEELKAQTAQQSADVAAKEEQYRDALEASQTPGQGVSADELADLRRQLEESRESEAELLRQLQETNDRLTSAASRPPEIRYKYLPAPVPPAPASPAGAVAEKQQPERPPAQQAPVQQTPVQQAAVQHVPVQTTPAPAAAAGPPPSSEPVARTLAPAVESRPAPERRAERETRPTQTASLAPPPVTAAPAVAAYPGKLLKRRVNVTSVPPPVPLANLPQSAARDLASTLAAALESTGKFVAEQRASSASASIAIAVTNFQAEANVKDAKKALSSATKIGRILGKNVPQTHVETARTGSYEAAMSLRVELFDLSGRPLTSVQPQAQATNRKNAFMVAGVPLGQAIMADTALGDVTRKLVGDAVEGLSAPLQAVEWTAPILNQRNEIVTIGAGRNSGIEIGDVFESVDAYGRAGARMRVSAIAYDTAEAEIVGTAASAKKTAPRVRFVGSENPPAAGGGDDRWLVTNTKTAGFEGPGNSFKQMRAIGPGTRLRFDYVVGSWARVSDAGGRFWVPMTVGTILTQ